MGQGESKRCRVCAMRLDPDNRREMDQALCAECRAKGGKALWDNRDVLKSVMLGGSSQPPDKKKKKKKGKKDKHEKPKRRKRA